MQNSVDSGSVVNYTNGTGSNIDAGDPVPIGKVTGIAVNDIANGATGPVSLKGRYTVDKKTSTEAITQGQVLKNDSGITGVAGSVGITIGKDIIAGIAAEDANSASSTVDVILGIPS